MDVQKTDYMWHCKGAQASVYSTALAVALSNHTGKNFGFSLFPQIFPLARAPSLFDCIAGADLAEEACKQQTLLEGDILPGRSMRWKDACSSGRQVGLTQR